MKRPATVQAAYCWALDDALREAGIEIPLPQRDLYVRSLFGLESEAARRFARGDANNFENPEPSNREPPVASSNDALEDAIRLSEFAVRKPNNGNF